jgi:hypothetical protein
MTLRDTVELLDLWLDVTSVTAREGEPRTEGFQPITVTGEPIVGFEGRQHLDREVSAEQWSALEAAIGGDHRVVFGMSSYSVPVVGLVAVVLGDGRVAVPGSCSYGMIARPLQDYGQHQGISAADALLLLLRSPEALKEFVAWQIDRERGGVVAWQDQPPETRIADRELIPPEILVTLEEAEISVPLVAWVRAIGRPICARSPQGWGSCVMANLTSDHVPVNAFVAPGEDIELWMANLPGDPARSMVADAVGPLAMVSYAPPTDGRYRQVTLAQTEATAADPPKSVEDVRARVDRGERLFTERSSS